MVRSQPTIGARLKTETHSFHARLEGEMGSLLRNPTREQYRSLLGRFYGFYAPFEQQISQRDEASRFLEDYDRRRKTSLLETDLRALGVIAVGGLPLCPRLPDTGSPAAALGCLYVLEGSTLGGRVIARHLRESGILDGEAGMSFFAGYGPATEKMWRSFQQALEECAQVEGRTDRMIAAAKETFAILEQWCSGGDAL